MPAEAPVMHGVERGHCLLCTEPSRRLLLFCAAGWGPRGASGRIRAVSSAGIKDKLRFVASGGSCLSGVAVTLLASSHAGEPLN